MSSPKETMTPEQDAAYSKWLYGLLHDLLEIVEELASRAAINKALEDYPNLAIIYLEWRARKARHEAENTRGEDNE